jgi:diguanylate cyclase (GGDEF)-like protein
MMFMVNHLRHPGEPAAVAWAAGAAASAVGLALLMLRSQLPPWPAVVAHNMMIQIAYGAILWGALRFDRRRAPIWVVFAGAGLWFLASLFPAFAESFDLRVTAASVSAIVHMLVFARVIHVGGRSEPLPSRLPLVMVLSGMAGVHGARIAFSLIRPLATYETGRGTWLGGLGVVMLSCVILAFLLSMLLIRERAEHRHRRSAQIDSLTGVFNRRAFLDEAGRRAAAAGERAWVLLFDLDRFKQINDTWGHAAGDRVLAAFADLVVMRCGGDDVFGRYGGEEFVLLLTDADQETAQAVAEAIRRDFAALDLRHRDQRIPATVSIGIAGGGGDVETMIGFADVGLYTAKRAGRDRVAVHRPSVAIGEAVRPVLVVGSGRVGPRGA